MEKKENFSKVYLVIAVVLILIGIKFFQGIMRQNPDLDSIKLGSYYLMMSPRGHFIITLPIILSLIMGFIRAYMEDDDKNWINGFLFGIVVIVIIAGYFVADIQTNNVMWLSVISYVIGYLLGCIADNESGFIRKTLKITIWCIFIGFLITWVYSFIIGIGLVGVAIRFIIIAAICGFFFAR